ncbi:MAG: hypothetical protein ACRDS9_11155, partial [Pseudonocardiaceae bacterium]
CTNSSPTHSETSISCFARSRRGTIFRLIQRGSRRAKAGYASRSSEGVRLTGVDRTRYVVALRRR